MRVLGKAGGGGREDDNNVRDWPRVHVQVPSSGQTVYQKAKRPTSAPLGETLCSFQNLAFTVPKTKEILGYN